MWTVTGAHIFHSAAFVCARLLLRVNRSNEFVCRSTVRATVDSFADTHVLIVPGKASGIKPKEFALSTANIEEQGIYDRLRELLVHALVLPLRSFIFFSLCPKSCVAPVAKVHHGVFRKSAGHWLLFFYDDQQKQWKICSIEQNEKKFVHEIFSVCGFDQWSPLHRCLWTSALSLVVWRRVCRRWPVVCESPARWLRTRRWCSSLRRLRVALLLTNDWLPSRQCLLTEFASEDDDELVDNDGVLTLSSNSPCRVMSGASNNNFVVTHSFIRGCASPFVT